MLDTKGPEIRLKDFAERFRPPDRRAGIYPDHRGGGGRRSPAARITYADLPNDVKAGDTILLDDGLVRLTVLETFRDGDPLPGGERRRDEESTRGSTSPACG